jgi:diguanylate cyclase (GGDEF)-like protein/hemerythrin-like metal-binding protein/PAS domain S-box-containing protein
MSPTAALIAQAEIFPWSDNFATGIDAIDLQHHKLVDLLNALAGHMAFGSDELTLLQVFDELASYAVHHFETEEAIWRQHLGDDAMATAHHQTHLDFVAEVGRVRGIAGALSDDETIEQIVSFLTHWLAFHILEDDTHLARIVLAVQNGKPLTEAKAFATQQMSGAAHILIEAVLKMYDSLSTRTLALLREMGQRQRAEAKLRISSNIIESSADAIFITDTQGLIIDANPAFCQHMQTGHNDLLGQSIIALKASLFVDATGLNIWDAATQAGHWAGQRQCRRPDGVLESVWLTLSTVKDEVHHTVHYVGMLSSISQLVQQHQALETAANHDLLTGLPNRRLLDDRLAQAMERSKRTNTLLTVCYLDLDHFKPINDTLGHDAGDVVLRVIAQRMAQALRGADTVARVGGDEFVLLLCDLAHAQEATQLLARLLQDVSQPIEVGTHLLQVGASMGATLYPMDTGTAQELLKHADLALYQAKACGKGCYRFFAAA